MNREATTVIGRVLDASGSSPVVGCGSRPRDADDSCGDLIAVAVSDALGEFQIALGDGYLRELFGERRPVLFFRIFDGDRLVVDTREGVRWDLRNWGERLWLCVNLAHPVASDQRSAPLVVRGRVKHATDGPLERVLVRAFDPGGLTDFAVCLPWRSGAATSGAVRRFRESCDL